MNNLIKFSRQAYLVSTALHSTRMLHSNTPVAIKPPARINHIIDAMEIGDTAKEPLHDILLRRQIKNFSKYSKQYEDNLNGIAHTQKLVRQELEKEKPRITQTELKELIYMSRTDEDLDLLARAINSYNTNLQFQDQRHVDQQRLYDYSRNLIELLYMLKKTSKAFEYFYDPNLRQLFRNHRVIEVFLKMLAETNDLNKFLTALYKVMPRYYKRSNENTNSNNNQNNSPSPSQSLPRRNDPLVIPVSHLDIISKFFLKQNSTESLSAFFELINQVEGRGVEVAPFFKLRCILLAFQQNNSQIAIDLMRSKFLSQDMSMQNNLKAIIFSKTHRYDDCLRVFKNIFIFGNKIFPFTLKMIRQDIENMPKDINLGYKNEIDFYFKRAYVDERIIEGEDLPDMLAGPMILNREVFVKDEKDDEKIDRNISFNEKQTSYNNFSGQQNERNSSSLPLKRTLKNPSLN